MCTGLWAHRIIIRNLSSSILERRKKRKVVFFFSFCLVFLLLFSIYVFGIIIIVVPVEKNPSEWRDQESHFSARLSRSPSLSFCFVLKLVSENKKLFSLFCPCTGILFSPFFFRSRYLWWYTVFVCSRGSVWTGQHHIDIHNLMLTWGSASPVVSALEPNFLFFFLSFAGLFFRNEPIPPIITSNWRWCNQISRWFPITSVISFFVLFCSPWLKVQRRLLSLTDM